MPDKFCSMYWQPFHVTCPKCPKNHFLNHCSNEATLFYLILKFHVVVLYGDQKALMTARSHQWEANDILLETYTLLEYIEEDVDAVISFMVSSII